MVNVTIKSRKDTLSNWQTSNPVLSDGEVAVVEIPATDSTPAICLIKIGDGVTPFSTLQYMQSPAADVYAWAKAAKKPEYDYSEITNLTTMIVAGNNITATTKDNKVTIATTQNVAKVPGTLPDIGDIEALPVWNSDEGWKRVDADALKATANTIVKRNASGQIVTAVPTANTHAANKKYVDEQASKIGTQTNKSQLSSIEYLGEADIPSTPEVGKEYAITDLISYSDLDTELQTKLDSSNDIVPKTGTVQLEITPTATQDISWKPLTESSETQVATIKVVKTSDGKLQVNITGSYYTSLDNGINEDFVIGTIPVVAGKTYTLPAIDTTALDENDNKGGYKWTTANPLVATTTGTQNLIMHVHYTANDSSKEVSGMKPIASTVSYTLADKGLLQKTDDGYVFAEAGDGIDITDSKIKVDNTVAKVPSSQLWTYAVPVYDKNINQWNSVTASYSNYGAYTIARRDATGRLVVNTPTEANQAANKNYVDNKATAGSIGWNKTLASTAGGVTPIGMAMSDFHSANRLAFSKAAGITIESSTDGGTTWVDSAIPDSGKVGLVSGIDSYHPTIGLVYPATYSTAGRTATANDKLRITLDGNAMGVYTSARKLLIYVTTIGATGCKVLVEGAKNADLTTFTELANQSISGWSGWNDITFSSGTKQVPFGGTSSVNYRIIRLTFSITSVQSGNYPGFLQIINLALFGDTYWTTPSNYAKSGHFYTWDYDQNVGFPKQVRTSSVPIADNDLTNKKYVDAKVAAVSTGGGSSKKLLRFDGNTTAYFDHVATSTYQYTFHLRGVTAMNPGCVKVTVGSTTLFNIEADTTGLDVDGTLMCYPASSSSSNTQHYITYSYKASDGTCKSGYTGPSTDMRVTFNGTVGAPASGLYTNWVIQEQLSCENWAGNSSDEEVDDTETI